MSLVPWYLLSSVSSLSFFFSYLLVSRNFSILSCVPFFSLFYSFNFFYLSLVILPLPFSLFHFLFSFPLSAFLLLFSLPCSVFRFFSFFVSSLCPYFCCVPLSPYFSSGLLFLPFVIFR